MIINPHWQAIIENNKIQKHLILKFNVSGNIQRFGTDNLEVIEATAKYTTGTVTVTNLSKTVTFSGTNLLGSVSSGNKFRITSSFNAPFYEIDTVDSNTQVTLKKFYQEESVSTSSFEILTDYTISKYQTGLELKSPISSSINLNSLTSVISSLNLSIDGSLRLQDLRSSYVLSNIIGELGLIVEGQLYEDRLQLGEGVLRNISWGDDEIPFSFTLLDLRNNLDRKFPSLKITSTNFPNANSDVIGNSYPVLYGSVVDSPCYYLGQVVTNHRWLVAGHDMHAITTARQDGSTFVPSATGTATDGDGNTYYYIESATDYSQNTVTVDANGTKTGTTFFKSAGDIIKDIVTDYSGLSGSQIDNVLFGTAVTKLKQWELSSIFNGHTKNEMSIFNTVQTRLTQQLPCIPVWRNGKYGIIVIDLDNKIPVLKLRLGKNIIARIGSITETPIEQVRNSFELYYGYNPRLSQFTKYKKADFTNNELLKKSYNKFGLLESSAISAVDIQSDTTADRLLDFKSKLLSDVFLIVEYICTYEASIIEEGDYVEVTDTDQEWSDKIFICTAKTYTLDQVKLTLREV